MYAGAQTEVPFNLAGGSQPLLIVPAKVNGRGPFPFVLDTGAGLSLLTPELASTVGVLSTESREARGAGGPVTIAIGRLESLAIGDVERTNLKIGITGDLLRIGERVGARIDGGLGYDFLGAFEMTIDYEARRLSLALPPSHGRPPDAEGTFVPFALAAPEKPLIIVPVKVNDLGPFPFALDTGASTTVVSENLAREAGVSAGVTTRMGAGGGDVMGSMARLDSLSLGGVRRERVDAAVAGFLGGLSQAVGRRLDGIVGFNFLREYKVTIDYPGRGLTLKSR